MKYPKLKRQSLTEFLEIMDYLHDYLPAGFPATVYIYEISTGTENVRNNSRIAGHARGKKSKSFKKSNTRQKHKSKHVNSDKDITALDIADNVKMVLILVTGKNEFRNFHETDRSKFNTNKKSVSNGLKDFNIDGAETHKEPACMDIERNKSQKASRVLNLDETKTEQKSPNSHRNRSESRNENSTKVETIDMEDLSSSKPARETTYISGGKEAKNWFQITQEADNEDSKLYDICEATSSTAGSSEVLNKKSYDHYFSIVYEKYLASNARTKLPLSVILRMTRHNGLELLRISETVLANVNDDMKKEIRTMKKGLGCVEECFYPSPRTGKKDDNAENEIEVPKVSNFGIKALKTRDYLEKDLYPPTRLFGHPKCKITENEGEGDSSKHETETPNMGNDDVKALEESQGHGHCSGHKLLEDVTKSKDEMSSCNEKTKMFQSSLIRYYVREEFELSVPMVNALKIIPVDKKSECEEMKSQRNIPFSNFRYQTFMDSCDQWHTDLLMLQQEDKKSFRDFISPLRTGNLYVYDVYMIPSYSQRHPQSINGIPWEDFERETLRVASFSRYPRNARKSATLLANSGFVYCGDGNSDKVICFFLLRREGKLAG